MIKFVVDGEPVAKARARVTRWGTYTPKKTTDYEAKVLQAYKDSYCKCYIKGEYLVLTVQAYFAIPKAATKAIKEKMLTGKIRPDKRPDFDNVAKIVTDALNMYAYPDDSQIIEAHIYKYYSDMPRVVVLIDKIQEVEE